MNFEFYEVVRAVNEVHSSEIKKPEQKTATIYKDIEIPIHKRAHAFSVGYLGRYAALAGKSIHFVDLDDPSKPEVTLKNPSTQKSFEFGAVEWNLHPDAPSYLAGAINTETYVWKVDPNASRFDLVGQMQAHKRVVSDLGWSCGEPQLLVTCAADNFIYVWDLRDFKKPKNAFRSYTAAPSKIEWNKHNPLIFASTHNNEVKVWDIRKDSPVTTWMAHVSRITAIDWSFENENSLLTCSEDKQVKLWQTSNVKNTTETIQIGAPVLRAKYTPFGKGVVTMTRSSDFGLALWSLADLSTPVRTYKYHVDSFDWRITEVDGFKEYQLCSFVKDQSLKLWAIDKSAKQAFGSNRHDQRNDSEFFPQDLSSEFALITKKNGIPGIQIDELILAKRIAMFTIEHDHKCLDIKVTFPELYPRNASPSFEFLPSSTVSDSLQANLRKFLYETSQFQVERNRPCLEHCLGKLVLLLKNVNVKKFDKSDPNASSLSSSFADKWFNLSGSTEMPTIEPSPKLKLPPDIIMYTVKPTDTLTGIALTFNMRPEQVRQFNNLHSDRLIPNQILYLKNPVAASTPPLSNVRDFKKRAHRATVAATKSDDKLLKPMVEVEEISKDPTRPNRSRSLLESKRSSIFAEKVGTKTTVEVFKEKAKYCSDDFHVWGNLTITADFFIFEPDLSDSYVAKNGVLPYQLYVNMSDIFDCQIIRENEKYYYDTSLEISILKEDSVKMYDFIMEEKQLRNCHKKILGWTAREGQQPVGEHTGEHASTIHRSLTNLDEIDRESSLGEVLPHVRPPSNLLNESFISQIAINLPIRYRYSDWTLLYGTQSHGISLNTLYTMCKDMGPTIIIIDDTKGFIFGGFVSDSWRIEPHYYGTGESFLFSLKPQVKFYHWTGKNSFFMCSRRDFISVGGGSHFGLWLDADFMNGSSATCETFNNPCLASSEDFQIYSVEVYGFTDKNNL